MPDRSRAAGWMIATACLVSGFVLPLAASPARAQRADDLLVRELAPREATALVDPRGRFQARAPATLVGEPARSEGIVRLTLDLGTSRPASCWIYPEEVDLAATLRRNSDALMPPSDSKDANGASDPEAPASPAPRQVYTLDAVVHEDLPLLVSDWIQQPPPDEAGVAPPPRLLKQMITMTQGRSLYCNHDEPGYSQTFARLFVALGSSLRWSDGPATAPGYLELSVAAIGKRRVGIRRFVVMPEAGGVRTELRTALIVPSGEDSFEAEDSLEVEWLDAAGGLQRQVQVQSRKGEPAAAFELVRDDDGYLAVGSGTRVTGDAPPLPGLGLRHLLRRLALELPARSQFLAWAPAIDARELVPGVVILDEPVSEGRIPARAELGEKGAVEIRMLLDPQGAPLSSQVVTDDGRIRFHRAYTAGDPCFGGCR